jgi:D-3-phosphoglycerate dehydrogenase / 2-oxoglutarate reductase
VSALRVLVAEKIGDSGIELLREHFDVDVLTGLAADELGERIADYDGILIRSATSLDADLLAKATRLRAVGRAGVGVDNVDVAAATKRGIVVANAPQSNVITAAEHTMALLLALARNVPQAHASLVSGRWERSKFSGVELYEKTLGILGFGRIGQLVAHRARGFNMHVIAYDPYVGAERYRELGVEQASSPDDVYAAADFLTLHLPKTPETEGWLNAATIAKCRDGVRVLNVARGPLVVDEDLKAAIDSGKVAGAALDVFRTEPVTEHPLFGYPNVIVTPHLGASTAEATDRAGYQAAEQVVAALTGGVVSSAVNVPSIPAEDMEVLGPYLPLCRSLGKIAIALAVAQGGSIDRVKTDFYGRLAERDTRLLAIEVLLGALSGHTEEEVNAVNAPAAAEERGIRVVEAKHSAARDYTDLVRVEITAGPSAVRVAGTLIGRVNRPHLVEVWGQRFDVELEDHVTLFRYRDLPGMLGRVGTLFGQHGVNIVSAAVGRQPDQEVTGDGRLAAMAITTNAPVPAQVVAQIVESDGFVAGQTVSL